MQEPNVTSRVPHPDDLVGDIKNCSKDCSYESNSKELNNVPMSICFLVREQAKSSVAIQEIQKRLSHVENVQAEVVDTIIQFRSYLCEATNSDVNLSQSYLNDSKNQTVPTDPARFNSTAYHSTLEAPRSILKNSAYSSRNSENVCNNFQRTTSIVAIHDQPQKHFDSTKSKESALESDKQDSGLDSDCRDHDVHLSVRNPVHWASHEPQDPLLQLLDEISFRSEYLQKQLAIVEESTILSDSKEGMNDSATVTAYSELKDQIRPAKKNSDPESTFEALDVSAIPNSKQLKPDSANVSQEVGIQVAIPTQPNPNESVFHGFLEKKSFCDPKTSNSKRKIGKHIDSALVSSILKETNTVELQRQVLIYLVDNAALNAKLQELEHVLACKNIQSEKVENSLKEEARLLMMENRELRICLDEQKMEINILKSRVAMLERVLQSMNVENQELNWQLGESLNLQQFSKKNFSNLSSSFSSGSSPNQMMRSIRKSSSLPSPGFRNSSSSCSKSKFHPNASSFLDTTVEEPEEVASNQVTRTKYRSGVMLSSTPFQKAKSSLADSPNAGLPTSFYSVKKCLKTGHSFDSEGASFKSAKSNSRYSANCDIPEACNKNSGSQSSASATSVFQGSSSEALMLPMGNVSKFPFNSILEKLKANSEYRLSRSGSSTKDSEASASASDLELEQGDGQVTSQNTDSKSPQVNGKGSVQTRKSRNIHQRIQNILDRIVAESEEAS